MVVAVVVVLLLLVRRLLLLVGEVAVVGVRTDERLRGGSALAGRWKSVGRS